MKTRLIIITLMVSLLTGCLIGPNYRRPTVKPPDVFRGGSDATPPADTTSLADLKWFEVFKDERLQGLIRTALVANYDLRDAVARVDAARANLGITRADQLPNVAASADVTTLRNSASGAFPLPQGFEQRRTIGSAALNLLSFEVDIWGRLRRGTEASRADLLATEENRKAVITTLVSDVAGAYFNLLELDMELEIAKRTLNTREGSLQLIRIRERGGLATLLEVRQGEQLVHAAAQAIPAIEQLIEQTENQISLLLGGSPAAITRGRPLTDQEQPPAVPPGLPSSLLERRPDIRGAEQNLVAANAIIGVAKAAYFPRISLTGFLGFQSNQLSNLFTGPTRAWQFVPQVTQPIFTAGRIKSNVRLAKAQQEIALIQYERVIQTAFGEVSDALIQYRKVREIRAKQELLVATLQDRSRLAYMRYRGGVDTLLNALDADRDLFDAELGIAQTRRNELLALVQLYRALGGGWQQ
ncbi:MAG: efflux transporter outer membrane subunit [Acidobacteria bacterium]|nr:efflux transporter outer membrane subunit [Acidobacteriota bacterium]MCI0722374.1 efflux transporter outer membrane subunit [Acidobacteriota bacterium]